LTLSGRQEKEGSEEGKGGGEKGRSGEKKRDVGSDGLG